MSKKIHKNLNISMYSFKRCIGTIIKYVKDEYNWNEKEYFASFRRVDIIQSGKKTQKLRVATFFITNIIMMENFLKEIKKENKPVGFGRFPGEFALEINIDDFSVIRRS